MKKIFSLFLSLVLVASMVMSTFSLNVFAEVTGGKFTNDSSVSYKYFEDDFENWNDSDWSSYKTMELTNQNNQGFRFYRRKNDLSGSNSFSSSLGRGAPLSVVTSDGNKYLELKDIVGDGYIYSRYLYYTNASGLADGEKLFLSIDLKTDDKNYDKQVGFSNHQNVSSSNLNEIITFDTDGYIHFFNESTSDYAYELGKWYHFDMIYDKSDNSVELCINDGATETNKSYTKNIDADLAGTRDDFTFLIDHSTTTNPDPADSTKAADDYDSSICVDNIKMLIYDPNVQGAEILSVNDGNEVPARTKNLTFTMSDDITTLSDGDITATPVGGGSANVATSWTVTSDGSEYIVNATFADRFTENKTYDLAINPRVYDGCKTLSDERVIVGLDTSGLTREFTVDDYAIDVTSPLTGDLVHLGLGHHINKSKILAVNSDALVAPNQKQLVFTISEPIPGLESNPGWVVAEDAQGNKNAATAVVISGTASPYTVTATLTENLAAWSEYTLKLSEKIYNDFGELNDADELVIPVQMPEDDFTEKFNVASTGFDMREKSITTDADSVDYVMEYTNVSSTCPPVTLLVPVFSADGIMQNISAVTLSDLPTGGGTKEAPISADFVAGQGAKLIAINGWTDKVPHFGKSWNVNATNKTLESYSSAEAVTVSDFDYDNFKVNIGVVASDAQVSGVLYVYEASATLSDSVKPIYADYLTSASDGTFTLEIPFKDTIDDDTPDNGTTYKVEFCAPGITPVSGTFTVYDADGIQAQKEAPILEAAKAAQTVAALRQAILGINDIEEVVKDNFEVFDVQANTDVYASLSNKEAVFTKMFAQKSAITDYASLVTLFQNCAVEQDNEESTPSYSPSTDNSSYGGSSVAVKDTPAVSGTSSQPSGSAAGASAFGDMNGHWASEYAAELSKRGIMNGYPDGSFKGENSITRAELAKTLVEAIGIEIGGNASYSDVAADAWYAPYIASAAAVGVVNGFENGTFAPDVNVNRQDAVLMLYRAMKLVKELPVGYTFFTDDFDIMDYASDAVRCLGDLGIVKGDPDVKFNPMNNITRAEVATIICRALDYIESH